jgi:hypothetical protein
MIFFGAKKIFFLNVQAWNDCNGKSLNAHIAPNQAASPSELDSMVPREAIIAEQDLLLSIRFIPLALDAKQLSAKQAFFRALMFDASNISTREEIWKTFKYKMHKDFQTTQYSKNIVRN